MNEQLGYLQVMFRRREEGGEPVAISGCIDRRDSEAYLEGIESMAEKGWLNITRHRPAVGSQVQIVRELAPIPEDQLLTLEEDSLVVAVNDGASV